MRIIHIKLNYFCREEKRFLGQEKREYLYNWRYFYEEIKLVNYIK